MCTTDNTTPVIVDGKLRTLGIVCPNDSTIIRLATDATLNGFGLDGDGPIKHVTGSKITFVVGPTGCSCPIWRNGEFCHHAAIFIVVTGTTQLLPIAPTATPTASPPSPLGLIVSLS